jgi:predicted dehydrogenase
VQKCRDLELRAIYSRSLKSATSVAEGLTDIDLYSNDSAGRDYTDLLQREDVQAVIIALPILVQPAFIKQALQAGKHVLAEKPLAKDVATGKELLEWYYANVDTKKTNFSIAEQIRFLPSYAYAAKTVASFGKVLGFRVRMQTCIQPGMKYLETEWRKKPEYQGGFLLDGGVHFVAGIRSMLKGGGEKVASVSAFTTLLKEYLPPVDTVDSIWCLSSGKTGTFSVSFGSTFSGAEWTVACEGGTVSVDRDEVTIVPKGGEKRVEKVKDEFGDVGVGSGVKMEVFGWARSLVSREWDARQSAEEGLADLEILEAMVRSGDERGKVVEIRHQI